MGSPFHYRCPQCSDPDQIDICAFVKVRLTASGERIIERDVDLADRCRSAAKTAHCAACGYEGKVKEFASPTAVDAARLAAATIKGLQHHPGDKVAAALARLGRAIGADRLISLYESRRRRH
jgi:predicted RNA-binding Zn-ribbon protein involved in translation (DUF1610 family)